MVVSANCPGYYRPGPGELVQEGRGRCPQCHVTTQRHNTTLRWAFIQKLFIPTFWLPNSMTRLWRLQIYNLILIWIWSWFFPSLWQHFNNVIFPIIASYFLKKYILHISAAAVIVAAAVLCIGGREEDLRIVKSYQDEWATLQRGKYQRNVRSSASVSCAASSVGASEGWWTTCTETTGTTSHGGVTSVMRGQPSWRLCTDTSDRSTTPSTAPVMSAGRRSAELSPWYSTLSRCLAFGSCFWLSLVGVNSDPEVWIQIWIQTYCRKPYTALSSKH